LLSSEFNGLGCQILDFLYESDLYDQEFWGLSSEFDCLSGHVLEPIYESDSFGIILDPSDYEFFTSDYEHSYAFLRAR